VTSRPRPDEDAVREQLRDERAEIEGAGPDGSASNGAAAEESPPEGAEAPGEAEAGAGAPERDDEVVALRRERDEYLDLAKRTQADFENYRKRAAKDIAAAGSRARVGVIRELLPVVDNLERALDSATDADHALVEGVRLVLSELQGVLQRNGIKPIDPSGDQFDPTVHEALSMREQDGAQAGVVLDVVEKGYRTDDVVIRPARVVVAS
jgi:molecular chaperone GrpE